MLNVQFSDSTEETIIGYFASPQDPAVWPNMGTVEVTDARWKTYYDAQPATSQQYLPAPQ
ncbi:hypothetical protein [Paraburkholderia kururiensis]|uniref:hypothetical protein n=1 Tax=Paraburkholderia kururiensis TaxID=984307 RepID=UPI0005AACA88|nr:hypothetical protein [Paraburkholderia kururiensis]